MVERRKEMRTSLTNSKWSSYIHLKRLRNMAKNSECMISRSGVEYGVIMMSKCALSSGDLRFECLTGYRLSSVRLVFSQ